MAEPDAFLQLVYEDKRIQRDLSASDPNMAGRGSSDPRCAPPGKSQGAGHQTKTTTKTNFISGFRWQTGVGAWPCGFLRLAIGFRPLLRKKCQKNKQTTFES